MSCVRTLEETHTDVHMDKSRTEMSNLLPDERTLRVEGRGRKAESGTRARRLLTKALFIPHVPPLGMWRQLETEKI